MKHLDFIETNRVKELSDCLFLVLQTYSHTDEDGDEGDKLIYNVSLEKNPHEILSITVDLYETYDLEQAKSFFAHLIDIYQAGKDSVKQKPIDQEEV